MRAPLSSNALPAAPERRWTLADPWLSLRHLAWHPASATLGIAMQAEHPRQADRREAPVLALLHAAWRSVFELLRSDSF